MNVLESRGGRPLRLRPWVLLVGAAAIVVVVLLLTGGLVPAHAPGLRDASGGGSRSGSSGSGGSSRPRLLRQDHEPRVGGAERGTEHDDHA